MKSFFVSLIIAIKNRVVVLSIMKYEISYLRPHFPFKVNEKLKQYSIMRLT